MSQQNMQKERFCLWRDIMRMQKITQRLPDGLNFNHSELSFFKGHIYFAFGRNFRQGSWKNHRSLVGLEGQLDCRHKIKVPVLWTQLKIQKLFQDAQVKQNPSNNRESVVGVSSWPWAGTRHCWIHEDTHSSYQGSVQGFRSLSQQSIFWNYSKNQHFL